MATVSISAHMPTVSPCGTTSAPPADINLLITSFAGLRLPRTLSLPVKSTTSVSDVLKTVLSRLPQINHQLILTTTSNKQLQLSNTDPISTLLSTNHDTFLPLRLSAKLCGGKGGFGSQLRAAGGRMSSRKNRNQNENPNGSNRNLDGRRLRTVDTAKKLAEYLATKPEMEKREQEERRKRWQAVVDAAEKKEEDIKNGRMGAGQGRLDADYVESKELAEERTREAVMKAMREIEGGKTGSESEVDGEEEGSEDEGEEGSSGSSEDLKVSEEDQKQQTFFGWDEDEDEDDSDDDDDEPTPAYEGKGKGKVP